MSTTGSIAAGEVLQLVDLVAPAAAGVANRVLAKTAGGIVTLFAFDEGKGLREHTAPFDALVLVLEGRLTVTIGGHLMDAAAGTIVRIPASSPHSVTARAASRMLLIVLKEPTGSASA